MRYTATTRISANGSASIRMLSIDKQALCHDADMKLVCYMTVTFGPTYGLELWLPRSIYFEIAILQECVKKLIKMYTEFSLSVRPCYTKFASPSFRSFFHGMLTISFIFIHTHYLTLWKPRDFRDWKSYFLFLYDLYTYMLRDIPIYHWSTFYGFRFFFIFAYEHHAWHNR